MIESLDAETGVITRLTVDDDTMIRRFNDAVQRVRDTPPGPRRESMRRHVYTQMVRLVDRKTALHALLDRQWDWLQGNKEDPRHDERYGTWTANLGAYEAVGAALDAAKDVA